MTSQNVTGRPSRLGGAGVHAGLLLFEMLTGTPLFTCQPTRGSD